MEQLELPTRNVPIAQSELGDVRLFQEAGKWAVEFRSRHRWARVGAWSDFKIAFEAYARTL